MSRSDAYEMNPVGGRGSVNPSFQDDNYGQPRGPSHVGVKIDGEEKEPLDGEPYYPEICQEDFEDLELNDEPNCLAKCAGGIYQGVSGSYRKHPNWYVRPLISALVGLYFAFFVWAMVTEQLKNESSIRLLWVTCVVVFCVLYSYFWAWKGSAINSWFDRKIASPWKYYNDEHDGNPNNIALGVFSVLVIAGLIAIIILFVAMKTPYNLVSLVGIVVQLLLCFIFSKHPDRVKWRPVLVGLLLQFIFALIILKTKPGFEVFKFLGDRVAEFLAHTTYGKAFVFDTPALALNAFAFNVLPIVLFFSSIISVLFYIGLMQKLIQNVSWFMQIMMGTTAGESLNAAANIFIGMTEAPLMIRPFLGRMTNSELHAVMTGGFATVAGSVLGAYISLGNPANHLISASVMSAPAALAVSKLIYPETKKSLTTSNAVQNLEKPPHKNLIEAAAAGVIASIPLVANIAAVIIAFLGILDFVNQTLTWCGHRVELKETLTFEFICSYLLWPLSFVMGVEFNDCRKVSQLIGVKTFINEFVAYDQLGAITKNSIYFRGNMSANPNFTEITAGSDTILMDPYLNTTITFKNGILRSSRSEVIATYSLCGFSNFGSIGIMIGALSAMAPTRQRDIAGLAFRAMIAGNIACFLTACIAGLFYEPPTGT